MQIAPQDTMATGECYEPGCPVRFHEEGPPAGWLQLRDRVHLVRAAPLLRVALLGQHL